MADFIANLGLKPDSFLTTVLILLAGSLLMGVLGRFIFGKHSSVSGAISSAIGILFIYAVTVVLQVTGWMPKRFIAPLPFISIQDHTLSVFSFMDADYTVICSNLLSMVILAFLMNLTDRWLPKGKHLFTWFFWRILSVAIAYCLHVIVVGLFTKYLPDGLVIHAPTVLLALLVILLLTGVLKILVGALLTTVNPIIGGLYTFFFATIIGKMVSKAMLTTLLLALLVFALNYFGLTSFSIAITALTAYIPVIIGLAVIWFVQHKFF